jgi:RND family efflux transporter MFP subunit
MFPGRLKAAPTSESGRLKAAPTSESGRLKAGPTANELAAPVLAIVLAIAVAGCGRGNGDAEAAAAEAPVSIRTARAVEQAITRFIRASGTLTAQDDAEVAAEISGRVVATPVERGMPVRMGAELIRIAATEVQAQAQEADANVAQIQARLGQPDGTLDLDRVPEVASAKATHDLAQADFARTRMLFEKKLIAQSEFDLRQAQVETTKRQYETSRNNALQQNEALAAAKARATLARKALSDTVVRAPFDGVVGERLVSVGDYVTRGTKVATVMRINPLRVELTVPAQHMAAVAVGRMVSFTIDAYPGQTFTGEVRYVSPDVRADSRSLVVEAVVPNHANTLRPGLFATALIEEASQSAGILVPSAAVRTIGGTSRVFVLVGDHVEERIVTVGQEVGQSERAGPADIDRLVEITTGVKAGETVATSGVNQLVDGTKIVAGAASRDPAYESSDVGRVPRSGPGGDN